LIEWTPVATKKINRIGYNKLKKRLYIDFNGSETDTTFLDVPESLYDIFIVVKSPDKFYEQLVVGYFEIAELSAHSKS
jgi:hypothetical protein